MEHLSPDQIVLFLSEHPDWTYDDDGMVRATFEFKDFLEALSFVNEVAEEAEQLQHHPDINIRYNEVTLAVVTHDEDDQVTENDFELIRRVDDLLL